jgi:hypothetical protein
LSDGKGLVPPAFAVLSQSLGLREFLSDAMQVSRKTYQYQLLNAGLRDGDMLERRYRLTAELG